MFLKTNEAVIVGCCVDVELVAKGFADAQLQLVTLLFLLVINTRFHADDEK